MPVMKVDVRAGETINFNGDGKVAVTMRAKSGQRARLEIHADPTININLPKRISARQIVQSGLKVKAA